MLFRCCVAINYTPTIHARNDTSSSMVDDDDDGDDDDDDDDDAGIM